MSDISKTIIPAWPAPSNIEALTTTRLLKSSDELNLPSTPILLKQIHGKNIITIGGEVLESKELFLKGSKTIPYSHASFGEEGDGVFTSQLNIVCGVRTADCVPVLMCDTQGEHVGAIHAGWKGIKAGVLENAISHFPVSKDKLLIWLGPCISQQNYEVQDDMKSQFGAEDDNAFIALPKGKYLCDLSELVKNRLQKCGLSKKQIYHANLCTFALENLFDSYRRDNKRPGGSSGRMMTLIWRKKLI